MRRSIGKTAVILALGLVLALSMEVRADSIQAVTFKVPGGTSFWGPGRSASSIDKRSTVALNILGKDVGVGSRVRASSGSVSGAYNGAVALKGADSHDLASGLFGFKTSFDPFSSSMSTAFGASIDVFGFVEDVGELSFPGFPKGNTLNSAFLAPLGLGTNKKFTGSTNIDVTGLDLWVVEFGATLKITQTTNFKPTSIQGTLKARHAGTGTTIQQNYTLGQKVNLDFGLEGRWDLSLEDLRLRNTFSTSFGGGIGGYVDSVLGRSELTTKPITFLSAEQFELGFGELDLFNAMSVNVFDSRAAAPPAGTAPVPEPGTWLLMGAVGIFVAVRRLRRTV